MKKRIIIPIAALILLCGILTGIGILLSSQKPEKTSEKKDRKSRTGITDQTRRNTGKPKAGTGESSVSKGIGKNKRKNHFLWIFPD